MSVKVTCNEVVVIVEEAVEKIGDSIVVNVCWVSSWRYVAVGDVKGWVCFYFGDNGFCLVLVR